MGMVMISPRSLSLLSEAHKHQNLQLHLQDVMGFTVIEVLQGVITHSAAHENIRISLAAMTHCALSLYYHAINKV